MRCRQRGEAAPSKRDYAFANEQLMPMVAGFRIDTDNHFPTHEVVQVLLRPGTPSGSLEVDPLGTAAAPKVPPGPKT